MKEERFSVEAWKKAELIRMQPKVAPTPPKTRTIPQFSEAQKRQVWMELQVLYGEAKKAHDAAKEALGRPLSEILKKK
jgi:hypothetical protein